MHSRSKFDIHAALDNALIEPLRRALGSTAKSDEVTTKSPRVHAIVQSNFREQDAESGASINNEDYYHEQV